MADRRIYAGYYRRYDGKLRATSPIRETRTHGGLHKTLLKRAGITENLRFHDFRHTCATFFGSILTGFDEFQC